MNESRDTIIQQLRHQKSLAIRLMAVGVVLILVGVPFFIQARQFNASAIRAPGRIVEVERQQSRNEVSYFPVFSFVDQTGGSHVIHSRIGLSHSGYAVGDAVEVLYSADNPENAKLNSFFSVWTWPAVFAGGGLILIIVGVVLWYGAVTCPVDEFVASETRKT